ncbi:MAG: hypothetical protein IIB53_07960, partial [Planctomycetes bacterium]|nr:hypothetical protein [Planctomycetota bacterium]
MTPEKCHIEVLLSELCEQLNAAHLPAAPACCTKWLKKDDETRLEKIVDPQCLDTATFLALTDKLKTLETYDSLLEALSSDPSFSNAPKAAGHWGLPSTLVQEVLHDASEVVDSTLCIDAERAVESLHRRRDWLTAERISYTASARMLGLKLEVPEVTLGHDLKIVLLTDKELNDRQPRVDPEYSHSPLPTDLLLHHAELQATVTVQVPDDPEHALFNAQNDATNKARVLIDQGLAALRLATAGKLEKGPLSVEGGFIQGGVTYSLQPLFVHMSQVTMCKTRGEEARRAFEIIKSADDEDRVLSRALGRFQLGRRRFDPLDEIIDYMIAWESILLTSESQSDKQELSYRFSLNGSSILRFLPNAMTRRSAFTKMKCAYKVRSAIVHGSDQAT